MNKIYPFLTALFLTAGGTAFAVEDNIPNDTAVIIDVRSISEYKKEHINGALHMPYKEIRALIGEQVKDKDQTIIVYCQSGRRAGIAKETLEAMGYTQVKNAGGIKDMKVHYKLATGATEKHGKQETGN